MKSAVKISDVIAFLRQLEMNNDRVWFKAHREQYDAVRLPWEQDVERLIQMVGNYDANVRGLGLKEAVYRIYRDTRFSKDKSPYKNYFSAVLGRGGRHTIMSGYYIHFQPDNLMMGGGVWWPERRILDQLRSLIAAEDEEFLKIVENPEFTSRYHWDSNALKSVPKDYHKDHPLAEYLKMKEYIAMMNLTPQYFDCDDWVERVADDLHALLPLHDFLNYVFEV